jgi:hypothetical protein
VPVVAGGELIGVLSLYASNPFTPEDEQACHVMVNDIIDAAGSSNHRGALVLQPTR